MLIRTAKHTPADLKTWESLEALDFMHARTPKHKEKVRRAMAEIAAFTRTGACWAGVSWGKDSMVIAGLCSELREYGGPIVPLAWVRVKPIENPECENIRDLYLATRPHPYFESEVWCRHDARGWHATGTLEQGFLAVAQHFGTRRSVRGIRGAESSTRAMSVGVHGTTTALACRPLAHWSAQDVFAYIASRGLPVHPAYAYSWRGQLDRARIRVSSLAGARGDGRERSHWERTYYPDEIAAIETGNIP